MEEWRLVALQSDGHHLYGAPEKELMQLLLEKQTAVHNALADSVDTPTAMRELLELVNRANVYVANRTKPYVPLLEKIARYIAEIFKVSEQYGWMNKYVDKKCILGIWFDAR
jgi:cysteinyl-tRNA synthetase